jgi:ubiquinone/menaquinone biosynthesis C-methylase UbiE
VRGAVERDRWAEWLLKRRFGGAGAERVLAELLPVRDRVLDGAEIDAETVLLDVGAGDGLIAFGALERGARGAIFSDASQNLLDHARSLAEEAGVAERCRFVHAPAEDLGAIGDASVDAVTTRSVLIYVKEKERALREFHRVLRPGGRLSLFEPINRYGMEERRERMWSFDAESERELAARVQAVFERTEAAESPMIDFDERDLVALAERAGFYPITLDLEIVVRPTQPQSWDEWANTAWNPNVPTLAEVMAEALNPAEAARLESVLRPQVEEGRGTWRMARAWLRARKPKP